MGRNSLRARMKVFTSWLKSKFSKSELDVVEVSSEDSFPASDAPSWTHMISGCPPSSSKRAKN